MKYQLECCQLPHKHKIVIAGNHELCFDPQLSSDTVEARSHWRPQSERHLGGQPQLNLAGKDGEDHKAAQCEDIKKELTNCTYLEDSSVEICGLKIYGKNL